MALTATSMANKIIAALQALGITDFDIDETADGSVTMRQTLEAMCQGIIEEIQQNAVVLQPNDSAGDTESPGTIT